VRVTGSVHCPWGGYAEFAIAHQGQCLQFPWASIGFRRRPTRSLFHVWSNVFIDGSPGTRRKLPHEWRYQRYRRNCNPDVSALGHAYSRPHGAPKSAAYVGILAPRALSTTNRGLRRRSFGGDRWQGVIDLEIVGGDYLPKDVDALATGGRMVLIGAARGSSAEINFNTVARKRLQLSGSLLRPRSPTYKRRSATRFWSTCGPLIAERRISPRLDSTFPLAEAASGTHGLSHARMSGRWCSRYDHCTGR